jgi:hypothetical protein
MANKRSKNGDSEKLDDVSIRRAIELLENKGTKKDACAILNIAYNTTRLGNIIEKYKERKEKDDARRAEKRGTPATQPEISYAVQSYLEGSPVDSIAKSLYRNSTFITNILLKYGVPMRNVPHDYFKPKLIPEEAMRDSFNIGEKVYSARYDSLAVIHGEFAKGVYRVYLLSDKWKQYAYQPAEELASLEHIRKLGIDI